MNLGVTAQEQEARSQQLNERFQVPEKVVGVFTTEQGWNDSGEQVGTCS